MTYCKDITNLLFWVLWACLPTTTKNRSAWRDFDFDLPAKNQIYLSLFDEIPLRYCKLVILGTLITIQLPELWKWTCKTCGGNPYLHWKFKKHYQGQTNKRNHVYSHHDFLEKRSNKVEELVHVNITRICFLLK